MQRQRQAVQQGLSDKGFVEYERTKHTYYIYHTINGEKSAVRTLVSRGTKYRSLGDELLGTMAKQCKLSKANFIKLVDCPLAREEYEDLLRNDGHL